MSWFYLAGVLGVSFALSNQQSLFVRLFYPLMWPILFTYRAALLLWP